MKNLGVRALRSSIIGTLVLAGLLFLPSWSLSYWQAWVFLLVFVASSAAITLYLAFNDPKLLESRMRVGPGAETEKTQKVIMTFAMAGFTALLVLPALDHRFGWSPTPASVSLVGDLLVAIGFLLVYYVFRENSYGASTIRIAKGQEVISTGPYALVRHPMYAAALVMLAGVPLALGSWLGLLALVVVVPVLAWRALDEEAFLARNLEGYTDYQDRVRWRFIPFVW